jgi:hypothetical protein
VVGNAVVAAVVVVMVVVVVVVVVFDVVMVVGQTQDKQECDTAFITPASHT